MLNFMKSFYNFSSENCDVSTGATQKWPLLLSSSVKRTRETHLLTLRGGKTSLIVQSNQWELSLHCLNFSGNWMPPLWFVAMHNKANLFVWHFWYMKPSVSICKAFYIEQTSTTVWDGLTAKKFSFIVHGDKSVCLTNWLQELSNFKMVARQPFLSNQPV